MSTLVQDSDLTTRVREREAMTPDQLQALADKTAQELLGMPWADAVALLERGELDGTGVEPTLRGIKRLLDA